MGLEQVLRTGKAERVAAESAESRVIPGDSWTNVASLGTERRRHSSFSDNEGRGYAVGGMDGGFSDLASVERYDPDTDSWTNVASLDTARQRHSSFSDNEGRGYAVGGEENSPLTGVERYDPDTDSWTNVASLDTARYRISSFSDAEGRGYAVGGEDSDNNELSSVERFNTVIAGPAVEVSVDESAQYFIQSSEASPEIRNLSKEITQTRRISAENNDTIQAQTEESYQIYKIN